MSRPIVLLHGSPGAPSAWKGVCRALGEASPVLVPALPDHGMAVQPPKRETAEMAAAVVRALGRQDSGIVLAGHSYGGNVALQIALAGEIEVAALVLLEPVALATLPALGEAAAYAEARQVFDAYVARGLAGETDAIGAMIDFWFGAGAFARMPPAAADFLRQQTAVNLRDVQATFREVHAVETLARLAMPVTIAWGTKSPAIARLIAEKLAGTVLQGNAVALDGADHGMLATHAPQIAALIAAAAGR